MVPTESSGRDFLEKMLYIAESFSFASSHRSFKKRGRSKDPSEAVTMDRRHSRMLSKNSSTVHSLELDRRLSPVLDVDTPPVNEDQIQVVEKTEVCYVQPFSAAI